MSSLRSLLASFHVEVDDKELKEAHEHMEGFRQLLKTTGNALAEAFAVREVREFVEDQIAAGTQLKATAERIGETTDELQAMQLAAGEASVSFEALSTGLEYLNRNIQQAIQGGGQQAQVFASLGIQLHDAHGHTKNAGDVIGELADKLQSIEDPTKRAYAAFTLLGRGGQELLPLLNKGSGAIEAARKELAELGGGLSEDYVEKAEEAEAANVRLSFAFRGLKSQLAEALFPIVKELAAELTTITARAEKFEHETGALSTAVTFFGVVAGFKALGTLKELLKTLGILRPTVLETVGAFLEFAAPLVAIALLYLAFDDLVKLLQGKDSLIGRFLGPQKKQFVEELRGAIDELKGAFDDLTGSIDGSDTSMSIFAQAVVDVAKAMAYLVELMAAVVEGAEKISGALTDVFSGNVLRGIASLQDIGKVGNPNRDAYDKDQNKAFDSQTKEITDQYRAMLQDQKVRRMLAARHAGQGYATGAFAGHQFGGSPDAYLPGGANFAGPMPEFGGPVTVNQNNTTKVEIHGAGDPKGTKRAVGSAIATENQRNMDRARTALKKP